jgi:O-antigen/teichoic acid export membrane protein
MNGGSAQEAGINRVPARGFARDGSLPWRLIESSFFLMIANFSVVSLGAVYRIIIARSVGDSGYGQYYFVQTVGGLFLMLAGFGMRNALTREIARGKDRIGILVAGGMVVRIFTGVATILLMYGLVPFLPLEKNVRVWIYIYGLTCIPQVAIDVSEAAFVGAEVPKFIAITNSVGNVFKVGVGALAINAGYGLTGVFIVLVVSTIIIAIGDLWILKRYVPGVVELWPAERSVAKRLFLDSLPFLSLIVTSTLYYRNDVFFLKWLTNDQQVGWYGAAYMPLDFLMTGANAALLAVYPVVSSLYVQSPERMREVFAKLSRYGWLIMLPFAAILTIMGKPVLILFLGNRFANAAEALKILCWATAIEVQVCLAGTFMNAMLKQNSIVKISVASLIINAGLNLILIPRFGYQGAASSMLISAFLTWIINMKVIRKAFSASVLRDSMARPVLAVGVSTVVLYALRHMGFLLPLAAFTFTYVVIAIATKATDGYERIVFKRLASWRRTAT